MPKRFHKICVIEDEPGLQQVLKLILKSEGYEVVCAENGVDGAELVIADGAVDLVLTDVRLPGITGIEVLLRIKKARPTLTVIVMSAYASIELAVEAMQHGAWHFISKPFKKDLIIHLLHQAEEREGLIEENRVLRERLAPNAEVPEIVGASEKMKWILETLKRVARFESPLLLEGESVTGKELFARSYHVTAGEGPFVALNCGAIPENLLESELFGHVKGSFTGAHADKEGLIRQANEGTLFLDEIGDLPLGLQVKLLRVLQESKVRPVGGSVEQSVSVRIVSATAKNLSEEVASGRFREDLFYRLNVVQVVIPPLRERNEDIPLLANHFLGRACERAGIPVKRLSPDALVSLARRTWRGNVRELQNTMERVAILVDGPLITPSDCGAVVPQETPPLGPVLVEGDLSIKRGTRRLEQLLITRALRASGGKKGKAAELLEISKRALLYKIKEYRILEE